MDTAIEAGLVDDTIGNLSLPQQLATIRDALGRNPEEMSDPSVLQEMLDSFAELKGGLDDIIDHGVADEARNQGLNDQQITSLAEQLETARDALESQLQSGDASQEEIQDALNKVSDMFGTVTNLMKAIDDAEMSPIRNLHSDLDADDAQLVAQSEEAEPIPRAVEDLEPVTDDEEEQESKEESEEEVEAA